MKNLFILIILTTIFSSCGIRVVENISLKENEEYNLTRYFPNYYAMEKEGVYDFEKNLVYDLFFVKYRSYFQATSGLIVRLRKLNDELIDSNGKKYLKGISFLILLDSNNLQVKEGALPLFKSWVVVDEKHNQVKPKSNPEDYQELFNEIVRNINLITEEEFESHMEELRKEYTSWDNSSEEEYETTLDSFYLEVKQNFKEVREDTYLLEFVEESKNGFNLGGQFTLYMPDKDLFSFFDRTDPNPEKWYNVSNTGKSGAGSLVWIQSKPPILTNSIEAQIKFNECIIRTREIILKNKK